MTTTRDRSYRYLFWTLALVGAVVDVGSKYAVFSWLDQGRNWIEVGGLQHRGYHLIPGLVSLVRQEQLNRGALFGLGNNPRHGVWSNRVFAVVSALAVIGITAWSFRRNFATDRLLCGALGLIAAGAAGNLYDRLVFGGVRDFIWVYYENAATGQLSFNFPVFNLADSMLCCGAALLFIQTFFRQEEPSASAVAAASATGSNAAG